MIPNRCKIFTEKLILFKGVPMTIYQFTLFTEKQKTRAVLASVFLAQRIEKEMIFQLYYLEGIFVEIWYDPVHNQIYSMKPFNNRKYLEPFLRKISIGEIIGY